MPQELFGSIFVLIECDLLLVGLCDLLLFNHHERFVLCMYSFGFTNILRIPLLLELLSMSLFVVVLPHFLYALLPGLCESLKHVSIHESMRVCRRVHVQLIGVILVRRAPVIVNIDI